MKSKYSIFNIQFLLFLLFLLPSLWQGSGMGFLFSQGTWTQKTSLGANEAREGTIAFSIGTKGYVTTGMNTINMSDFLWEWDQAANSWSQKASIPGATTARAEGVGFSIGTKGYVSLGKGTGVDAQLWEWDQTGNSWTSISNFPGTGTPSRTGGVAFSIGAKGYIGLGTDSNTTYVDFWEWDQTGNFWTQRANFTGPSRTAAVGFSIPGTAKGYIGTGNGGLTLYKDFYEWDQASNTWSQKASLPSAASGRWQAHGFGVCGKGYIGLGAIDVFWNNFANDFYEWDPGTNTWAATTAFPGTGRREGSSFVIGGQAYTGMGVRNVGGPYFSDLWEFSPSSLGTITFSQSPQTICAGQSFNFTNTSSLSNQTSWNWSFPGATTTSSTSQNPTGISYAGAGTYNVTLSVTTSGACAGTFSLTQTVQVDGLPVVAVVSGSNSVCNGGSTVLTASGGNTYVWSTGATTSSITVSPASTTTYCVTATNACGTDTACSTVNLSSGSFSATTSGTPASCGNCAGTATVTPSGGSSYTYAWSNGPSTQTISGLCAGTYTVTVTSTTSGGPAVFWCETFDPGTSLCTSNNAGAGWTLNQTSGTNDPQPNQWIINTACSGCGSAANSLNIQCDPNEFICQIIGPACNYNATIATDKFASSPNISTIGKTGITLKFKYQAVGQPGINYGNVRLSNDGGATWTDLSTQYAGTASCTQATIVIPAIYENISNFQIGFRWRNDASNQGSDPAFTIDDIELSSASGGGSTCITSASVTIGSSPAVDVIASATAASCGTNNGTATANPSGGTSPYNYNWNTTPPQSAVTATGLGSGNYSVTVTDAAGCTDTTSITVIQPNAPAVTTSATQANCGLSNGTATAAITSGTTPYSYLWSTTPQQTTVQATGLAPGNYSVTVTDGNNCTATSTATVTNPNAPAATATSTPTNCGSSNGTATANPTGGTSPYTYNWSTTPPQTTVQATGLAAGSYTVTVTDASNCVATASATVTSSGGPTLTTSFVSPTCNGSTNGSATATAISGTTPFTYNWNTTPPQTGQTATGLTAGTYNVTITDPNSCTATASVTITQPSVISLSSTSANASCGANDGSATVTASGGTSPYTYQWGANANNQTTSTATALAAGGYSVTVTDTNNCTQTITATVNNTGAPTVQTTSNGPNCNGGNNGTASVVASGGISPYTYLWSNSSANDTVTGLAAGTYTVTVTDAANCNSVSTVTLNNPAPVTALITGADTICRGTATNITASGGGAGTTYSWSTGQSGSQISVSPSITTNYIVTATNVNGCTGTDTLKVEVLSGPISAVSNDTIITYGTTIQLNASGGNTYLWSTGENTKEITVSPVENTTYTVTVTDASGCSDIATIKITIDDSQHSISVPTIFSPNGDGNNDFIKVHGYGIKEFKLTIYDRWGEKIFFTTDKSVYWDGTFKGNSLNSAVFVYFLDATFADETTFHEKGNITLLR